MRCDARASLEEEPVIKVESSIPVEIKVCWGEGHRKTIRT